MRERARGIRRADPQPGVAQAINFHFNSVNLRDIMNAGAVHGISVSFDREFAARPPSASRGDADKRSTRS
jgi:hypothetical protein